MDFAPRIGLVGHDVRPSHQLGLVLVAPQFPLKVGAGAAQHTQRRPPFWADVEIVPHCRHAGLNVVAPGNKAVAGGLAGDPLLLEFLRVQFDREPARADFAEASAVHVDEESVEVLPDALLPHLLAEDDGIAVPDVELVVDQEHRLVWRHGCEKHGGDCVSRVDGRVPAPVGRHGEVL